LHEKALKCNKKRGKNIEKYAEETEMASKGTQTHPKKASKTLKLRKS